MAGAIFVLRYNNNPTEFAEAFLASTDFEMDMLRQFARRIDLAASGRSKSELINLITRQLRGNYESSPYLPVLIQQLVARPKDAISVKVGRILHFPILANANELVTTAGSENWYGPLNCPGDDQYTRWYIRPQFVEYWDILPGEEAPTKLQARWLCFARTTESSLSLHWRGFTYPNGPDGVLNSAKRIQFPYWAYIPKFFEEISQLTKANLNYVNLHDLLLHHLWDKFLEDKHYNWTHTRIRAESSGVSLNAHAGVTDADLNIGGILHLARTVRTAVQKELASKGYVMPSPEHIDNTILRTLIREYGALSYGFHLSAWGQSIFKAHSYFGLKPNSRSPDSFPHMQVSISEKDALEQLQFILAHAKDVKHSGDSEHNQVPAF